MKRVLITTAAGGLCLAFILNAAITADPNATAAAPLPARAASKGLVPDENLKIVERGADQRVWERKVTVPLPGGRTATELRRFTELATGMHVKQADGSWKEASDEIVITPGGAALLGTRHKVYFPADIGKGVLRIVLPDGREMSSRPLGLGYSDGSQSVLIAELKSSVSGQLMPSKRQVVYADAFIGVHADLVVSVSKSGLESDVVFREQPGTPESLQLNPATARLQVLTEWFGGIEPVKRLVGGTTSTPTPSGATPAIPVLPDTELSFGSMRMGAGKAFGTADGQREGRGVRVSKSWTKLGSGRTFLMEEVPFEAVRRQLQKLPRLAAVSGSKPFMALRSDSPDTPLPEARAIESGRGAIELAQADLKQDGFVMDYVINLTVYNYGPFTFANNTTYYISGPVYVGWWNEPVTLEGGAVIKFADSGSISLVGPLTCKTAPYRPAVFTSENDLSVGEPVGYGTPTRGTGTYLYDYGGNAMLHHVRFAYAGTAWDTTVGFDAEFWHCQFVNCGTAVYRESTGNNSFYNVLASHCGTLLNTPDYSSLYGEHLTLDYCGSFGVASATLVNTLITGDNGNNLDLVGQDLSWVTMTCSYQDTTGNAYQTRGGGKYYLVSESGYRNAGTASINSQLMADLGKLTTYPPAVYESATLDTVQTLGPQAPRGGLDIGYHYDPLDYVFAGSDVNANLTFAPGTVVGWYRTSQGWQHAGHGIHLADNVTLTFDGRADAPTYYVRCNTVQEADNQLWYGPGGITGWSLSAANAPSLVARFTRFSMLGNEWANHYRDDWGYLKIAATHSEFWGGAVGSYGSQHNYTNCLFDRAIIYLQTSDTDLMCLNMRNCTMIGGQLGTHHWSSAAWPQSIRDCVFDGTVVTYSGLTSAADADYNAFLTGANRVSPQGAHDQVVNGFNWQAGLLGAHYLPSGSPLIDAGSRRADAAGLFHFTTQTDQAGQAKEATSVVDLGHHYAAANLSGLPTDADGDGIPDFLEDANGNGLADNGEAAWDGDSDGDDLPDGWEWKHFGDLNQDGNGDFDGDWSVNGVNIDEYFSGKDPNTVNFQPIVTNDHFNTGTFLVSLEVNGGIPAQMAVLVDPASFTTPPWQIFGSNLTVPFPQADGSHEVWIGLRGRASDSVPTWQPLRIWKDTQPPVITITNPVQMQTSQPVIQLQGYSREPLSGLRFDVVNANGSVTNEEGLVTHQHFDTNLFAFTTNFFQCYDIDLAPGTNSITLHATDLAGNLATVNLTLTLDFSGDQTPPVITNYWPPSGARLSGEEFTWRGWVDDPTATVSVQVSGPGGATTTVSALVERNGLCWAEGVPLYDGVNTLTLTATDAAGNVAAAAQITIQKSTVALTITDIPDEWIGRGDVAYVSGTISDATSEVWVNGQQATVNGNSWSAEHVPLPAGGTVVIQARAIPAASGHGSASGNNALGDPGNPADPQATDNELLKDKPMRWYVESYETDTRRTLGPFNPPDPNWPPYSYSSMYGTYMRYPLVGSEHANWNDQKGGDASTHYEWGEQAWFRFWPNPLEGESAIDTSSETHWGASKWPTIPFGDFTYTSRHFAHDGEIETTTFSGAISPLGIPFEYAEATSRAGLWSFWEGRYWGLVKGTRNRKVILKLETGGKALSRSRSLFSISASATRLDPFLMMDLNDNENLYIEQIDSMDPPLAGNTTIAPERIFIGNFGKLGSDGVLYKALPDNESFEITPTVRGEKYYGFNVNPVKHVPKIVATGAGKTVVLEPGRLAANAEFSVGHKIVFSLQFEPSLPTGAIQASQTKYRWVLPPKYVNAFEEFFRPSIGGEGAFYLHTCYPEEIQFSRPAAFSVHFPPYCKRYQTVDWPLTKPATGAWWVSGGLKLVSCYWDLAFANGQQSSLNSRGQFSVHRPTFKNFTTTNPAFPNSSRSFEWDGNILSYGDLQTGENGLYWRIEVDSKYDGSLSIVQLVKAQYTQNYGLCPNCRDTLDTHGTFWLDGNNENYESGQYKVSIQQSHVISLTDQPNADLWALPGNGFNVRVWGQYEDYLRFKPDGADSIFVTIGKNMWSMEGMATSASGITINNTPAPSQPTDSDEFPIWNDVQSE